METHKQSDGLTNAPTQSIQMYSVEDSLAFENSVSLLSKNQKWRFVISFLFSYLCCVIISTQSIQYNIEDYRTLLNYMFNCLEREDLSNILSLSTSKKKTKRKTIESEIFQNHYIKIVHTLVVLVVFSLCVFQMFSDGEKERNSQYWRLEDPENVFFLSRSRSESFIYANTLY